MQFLTRLTKLMSSPPTVSVANEGFPNIGRSPGHSKTLAGVKTLKTSDWTDTVFEVELSGIAKVVGSTSVVVAPEHAAKFSLLYTF